MKKALQISIGLIALIFLAGCNVMPSYVGFQDFEDSLMSSYRMLGYDEYTVEQSRAAAPVWLESKPFDGGPYTQVNYPEVGQDTEWTYSLDSGTQGLADAVYKVTSITTYPKDPFILRTEEVYYVKDAVTGTVGSHDEDDAIVDSTGTPDSKYREVFRTLFADGTSRRDVIVNDSTEGTSQQFALFDVNGSLDYDSAAPTLDAFAVEADRWSSVVSFGHNTVQDRVWSFWGEVKKLSVEGTRYYSRQDNIQTYLIKENGAANDAVWALDNVSPVNQRGPGRNLFTGVIRIQINDTTGAKTTVGEYRIFSPNGTLQHVIDIYNNKITLRR